MLKLFTDSRTCRSKVHCDACRGSRAFRRSLASSYGLPLGKLDFPCPHGMGPVSELSDEDAPPPTTDAASVEKRGPWYAERVEICKACPEMKQTLRRFGIPLMSCGVLLADAIRLKRASCGCVIRWKAAMRSESCPLGKWPEP